MTNEDQCQKCGTPASPGAKYCESCGALLPGAEPQPPLTAPSESQSEAQPDRCTQCGTPASPGAKFCERCGTPLPGAVPYAPYGTPAPSYAPPYAPYHAPTAVPYEGVAIRFVAILIDSIIISIVASIFSRGGSAGGFASLVVGLLYFVLLEGYYGQTVGKMAVKIKVVREADGGPIDYSQAAVRTVLRVIDLIPYFIPYLLGAILIWSSDNNKKQRLGDRVAHTVVVRKP
ncbi:MAG: RDD family protein [Halobacteriota archaeon]